MTNTIYYTIQRPPGEKSKVLDHSKCFPRLGSARRFSTALRSFRPGRTTITGTGECERQYLDARYRKLRTTSREGKYEIRTC